MTTQEALEAWRVAKEVMERTHGATQLAERHAMTCRNAEIEAKKAEESAWERVLELRGKP